MTSANPWRFLSPLEDNDSDRQLLGLTRPDELRIVTDLIASSNATILYAHSGIGKSSLVNSGLIPILKGRGYFVFPTRPRPPWSMADPTRAFKDCILRGLEIPKLSREDTLQLEALRDQLDRFLAQKGDIDLDSLDDLKAKISCFHQDKAAWQELHERLSTLIDAPLTEFLAELRAFAGPRVKIVMICDQFEELFVHYGNTAEMFHFVEQIGQVRRHKGLDIHFLFSLREDWVGCMIEFRQAIPTVFHHYFKLNPLTVSRASAILRVPPIQFGVTFQADAVQHILTDLSACYSNNLREKGNVLALVPSDSEDPYIELPALQILADKMWQTRNQVNHPFTLDHYQSLSTSPDTSPAQWVLDHYITDQLDQIKDDNQSEKGMRRLRTDILYLLTDGSRHRRGLKSETLLSMLKKRPAASQDEVTPRDSRHLQAVIEPLVECRLVRHFQTSDGQGKYELAHDFAVRTVVRIWTALDRQRSAEEAVYREVLQEKEARLAQMENREKFLLNWLQTSTIGVFAISALCLFEYFMNRNAFLLSFDFWESMMALLFGFVAARFALSLVMRFFSNAMLDLSLLILVFAHVATRPLRGEQLKLGTSVDTVWYSSLSCIGLITLGILLSGVLRSLFKNRRFVNILSLELVGAAIIFTINIFLISYSINVIKLENIFPDSTGLEKTIGFLIPTILYVVVTSLLLSKGRNFGSYHLVKLSGQDAGFFQVLWRQILFIGWLMAIAYLTSILYSTFELDGLASGMIIVLLLWVASSYVVYLISGGIGNIYDVLSFTTPAFGDGPPVLKTRSRIFLNVAKKISNLVSIASSITKMMSGIRLD